jgi:hypothetical protein
MNLRYVWFTPTEYQPKSWYDQPFSKRFDRRQITRNWRENELHLTDWAELVANQTAAKLHGRAKFLVSSIG